MLELCSYTPKETDNPVNRMTFLGVSSNWKMISLR